MNTQMPIYLMSGVRGGNSKATTSIIRPVFKETGKTTPTIAYVGAASEDNWVFFKPISGMIRQAGECRIKRVSICSRKADLNEAKDILSCADAVFVSGGDVERGMKVLEEKGLIEFFQHLCQQGLVLFGASAGSIMLAQEWVRWRDPEDDSTAELFPCLGIALVICDTHAEEDDWNELKAALQFKEAGTIGYGIISGSCLKVYPDGSLEAMNGAIARYILQNGKVERQADLLPVDNTK